MKVGIFGGTFDPVHNGHLALAGAALAAFGLDRVLFVPGHVTPFKIDDRIASDADRLAMVRLATDGNPRFEVSSVEIDRGGISYTVDTLETLHASHPDWQLWLLLGSDSLLSLGRWHRASDIVQIARVGTLRRPDAPLPNRLPGFSPDVSRELLANVADGDCPDISSSDLRQRIATGDSVEGLVPPAVAQYIARRNLYAAV